MVCGRHDVHSIAEVLSWMRGYQLNRYTWSIGVLAIILGGFGIPAFAGGWFTVALPYSAKVIAGSRVS